MKEQPLKIIIELPPDKAAQLYHDYLKEAVAKDEAVRLSVEFTTSISPALPETSAPVVPEGDMFLLSVVTQVKELLPESLSKALRFLKQKLRHDSEAFDELIALFARHNRISAALQKGLIDFQLAEQEFVKIDAAIIFLLNGLRRDHLI